LDIFVSHINKIKELMKKIFITFILSILCLNGLYAQESALVRFGAKAGFNMTKWGGDFNKKDKTSFLPGFHAGGVAEMMLSPKWSIQPELLFSFEGTNTELLDDIRAMYIKIPVLFYYNFRTGPGRLSPGIGPYFSAGIGGKAGNDINTFGSKGLTSHFDWGLQVKVSYDLYYMNSNLEGLFGALGFSQGFGDSHSIGLSLSVGYKFGYSKWLNRPFYYR
jgi:hypothetical protein